MMAGRTTATVVIQQHAAVHLAGEADRANRRGLRAAFRQRCANRLAAGAPPVFGLLFGPGRLRRRERRVLDRRRRDDSTVFVDDDDTRTARSDVDAEDEKPLPVCAASATLGGKFNRLWQIARRRIGATALRAVLLHVA